MDKHTEDLGLWLRSLKDFNLPEYQQLPEIDLYMDQVLSYMDKRLAPLASTPGELAITSFMVNNYVKANLISPPSLKKYSRVQIGYLIAVSSVKQILSMSDIKLLFDMDNLVSPEKDKLYSFFRDVHDEILHDVEKQVNAKYDVIMRRYKDDLEKGDPHAVEILRANLGYVAFKMSIEAEINKVIADRIIFEVGESLKDEKAEAARLSALAEAQKGKKKK